MKTTRTKLREYFKFEALLAPNGQKKSPGNVGRGCGT